MVVEYRGFEWIVLFPLPHFHVVLLVSESCNSRRRSMFCSPLLIRDERTRQEPLRPSTRFNKWKSRVKITGHSSKNTNDRIRCSQSSSAAPVVRILLAGVSFASCGLLWRTDRSFSGSPGKSVHVLCVSWSMSGVHFYFLNGRCFGRLVLESRRRVPAVHSRVELAALRLYIVIECVLESAGRSFGARCVDRKAHRKQANKRTAEQKKPQPVLQFCAWGGARRSREKSGSQSGTKSP